MHLNSVIEFIYLVRVRCMTKMIWKTLVSDMKGKALMTLYVLIPMLLRNVELKFFFH